MRNEALYTSLDFIKINVSSWNMGGVKPMEDIDINKWLFPFENDFMPEIFVLGFQEIIGLNVTNVVMSNKNKESRVAYWDKIIQKSLDKRT